MVISNISTHRANEMLAPIGMSLNSHGQIAGDEVIDARMVVPPASSSELLKFSYQIVGLIPETDWIIFQFNLGGLGPCGAASKFHIARVLFGPEVSVDAVVGPSLHFGKDDHRHRFILSDLVYLTLLYDFDADLVWSSSAGKEKISMQDGRLYVSSDSASADFGSSLASDVSLESWVSDFDRDIEDGRFGN